MNFTEMKKALPILLRNNVVPFIWGAQGVGKTQGVKQVAQSLGGGFVHLHLATQEVGDLVGLLVHSPDGSVKHARPAWFPTEGEGVVYLDELNRATPDVLQALFSFITDGTIHTHKLPAGWKVVAAGNYQTNAFNVTDTSDSAWMSRFCHLDFMPTVEEFVVYAEETTAYSVADFIREHPEMLEVKHKERLNLNMITPDRRAWLDMLGALEKEKSLEPVRYEVYCGIVGATAAASFMTFKKADTGRIRGRDVLDRLEDVRDKVEEASNLSTNRFDLLNAALEEILCYLPKNPLSPKQMDNFKAFILMVPVELTLKISKDLTGLDWKQKNEILNSVSFVRLMAKKLNT